MKHRIFFLATALISNSGLVCAQTVSTVVGTGTAGYSGDGGPAAQATINRAVYVATDLFGNLFIADQNNNRVRRVNSKGIITTVAGNGNAGFSGDGGPATQASLNSPTGVCTDPSGDLFIADVGNFRIRKVDTSGNITTVAGNGIEAASGDGGPATQASMYIPIRCVVDSTGNLYVTDQSGQKIRMINPSGTISTFAGTGANAGPHSIGLFSGDGGPATAADLNNPTAITVDSAGNIYFSDQYNQRIRRWIRTASLPRSQAMVPPALWGTVARPRRRNSTILAAWW
jgi:trimeric autotransporter adhesin